MENKRMLEARSGIWLQIGVQGDSNGILIQGGAPVDRFRLVELTPLTVGCKNQLTYLGDQHCSIHESRVPKGPICGYDSYPFIHGHRN